MHESGIYADLSSLELMNDRIGREVMAEEIITKLRSDTEIYPGDCIFMELASHYDVDNKRIVIDPASIDPNSLYQYERLQEKYGNRLAKSMYQQQPISSDEFRSYITIGLGLSVVIFED